MKAMCAKTLVLRKRGQASLIGLLVVMLIIGIMAAVLYPKIAGRSEYSETGAVVGPASPLDRADDTACTVYMEQVSQAAMMYRQDHGTPPPDLESLKPYGVNNQIINTPNCNFGLPKNAAQPGQGAAGAPQAYQPPAAFPAPPVQPAANPNPGYTVVGGVKVPTSAGSDGGALGQ